MPLRLRHYSEKSYIDWLDDLKQPVKGRVVSRIESYKRGEREPDIRKISEIEGVYEIRFRFGSEPRIYFIWIEVDSVKYAYAISYGYQHQRKHIDRIKTVLKRITK